MNSVGRIFISHASIDKPLAEAMIDMFVVGLGLSLDHIFCTSVEGHTIPAGVEFKEFMRHELTTGAAVVGLISHAYLESTWSVCELGATWGLAKEFYPVLISPVNYKSLPSFLAGTQSLLIENDSHLDRLSDGLPKLFGKTFSIAKWNTKKSQFLRSLPKILETVSKQTRPTEQEIAALRTELQDYKALVDELTEQNEQLTAKLTAVSKLKDKEETTRVLQSFSGESEQFKQLVTNARSAVHDVAWATKEALFQWYRGDKFFPRVDWPREDVDPAVESGELTQDGNVFEVNAEKPRVKRAIDALGELRSFAREPSAEFLECFEQKYDDNFDTTSRDFWDRFIKGRG